jgi:hypothetical protein
MTGDPWDDPRTRRWEAHVRHQVFPMIERSAAFIAIAPPEPDVKSAVELGYGLLLDKPLLVIATPGRLVPSRLARAADMVIAGELGDGAIAAKVREFLDRSAAS